MNTLFFIIPIIALLALWFTTRTSKRGTATVAISPRVRGTNTATDIRVGPVRVTNVYSTDGLNMTTTKMGVRFVVKAGHKVSGRINGIPFSLFTDKAEEVFDLDARGSIIRPGPESLAPQVYDPFDN